MSEEPKRYCDACLDCGAAIGIGEGRCLYCRMKIEPTSRESTDGSGGREVGRTAGDLVSFLDPSLIALTMAAHARMTRRGRR